MEDFLNTIGKEWARQDRKRRRLAKSAASDASGPAESSSYDSAESVAETGSCLHATVGHHGVQKRLYEAVRGAIRETNDRSLNAGATLVARTTYAVFSTVQALKPLTYGPQWACLLYLSLLAFCNEFLQPELHSVPEDAWHDKLNVRSLRALIRRLGMGPSDSEDDENLMMAARKWERLPEDDLDKSLSTVFEVVVDASRTRAAVRNVLWPCHRAHLLFETPRTR